MIGANAVFILILHASPVPPRQLGSYEFVTRSACQSAAPGIIRMNSAAYPNVHFTGFACLRASDDLR
jgi:hypothetical protein